MDLIIKILKRISRIIRIIANINWHRFRKLYHSKSEVLLWIPRISLKYFGTDAFIWDMATIAALIKRNQPFKLVSGRSIGKNHFKKIFFSLGNQYNVYGFKNYTDILHHITVQLEFQDNQVFPSSHETALWENKAHMHRIFKRAKVNEPETIVFDSFDELINANVNFPFLIKAEHSCSSEGLYKISSWVDLADMVTDHEFNRQNRHIIVQELINMRKDLRVILVKDEVVLHYWRINPDKEWKPTSTSYGSEVDFDFFPEQWREHIINTFKKLGITTGAFDITWENDDLSTPPVYLEVSPYYQPNPKMDTRKRPYFFYKKNFRLFNSWDTRYVDLVFTIKEKQVDAYLENASAELSSTPNLI